jgi:Uncharacterized protein with a bacterial SH3 domain homologue
MKRLCGILTLSLASGLALAAPGVALKDENVLSKPSATSAAVGKMTKGMAVDIVAKQGGWLQVKAGGKQGWVRLLSVRAGAGGAGGNGLAGVAGVAGAVTQKSDPSRVVAVAGVRGLNEEDLKGAKFNAQELAKLEGYAVTASQAKAFADKSGLKAVKIKALPKPDAEADGETL